MAHLENGVIDGPLTVSGDFVLNGMANGPITVESGGELVLSGKASAGLDVHDGGRATVTGMLSGGLRCSGEVELTGLIERPIFVAPGGHVVAAEGASRRERGGATVAMSAGGSWAPAEGRAYLVDTSTKRWPVASD
ncbi:hypothetical protein [Cellulomonas sp. SG140]|uniref:hypothetical protein n=1 Tax=Cellulomonas sp. SG140 TaxID=2976536 RepID=UPI0021E83F9E|nr:hypothetical protein [Cellulomonas sp. SG140]